MTRALAFCLFLICLAADVVYAAPAARDRHVVIISLDGFAAEALANPDQATPNLRRLAAQGAVAAAMTPVNPTVTWPNHTSIATGVRPARHTVLFNGRATRQGEGKPVRVEPHVPKDQLVRGMTLYDAAHGAGLTTAEVDWVAIENARTITWSFSEFDQPNGTLQKEMVAAGRATADEIARFGKAPITFKDELWTRAGEYLLETKKPNLLLLHLLTTDSVQHRHGPEDVAGSTALALADAQVGRLVEAARRGGILERTTFFVVSDHGFRSFTKSIRPNAALAKKGMGKIGWSQSEGGTAMVFATGSGDKERDVAALRETLASLEGVAQTLGRGELAAHGYPEPGETPDMADLVLVAKAGYAFSNDATGEPLVDRGEAHPAGSHGYLASDRAMGAIFIASGAGIARGVRLDSVASIDVAPTAAALLGLALPAAEGRVLKEILSTP